MARLCGCRVCSRYDSLLATIVLMMDGCALAITLDHSHCNFFQEATVVTGERLKQRNTGGPSRMRCESRVHTVCKWLAQRRFLCDLRQRLETLTSGTLRSRASSATWQLSSSSRMVVCFSWSRSKVVSRLDEAHSQAKKTGYGSEHKSQVWSSRQRLSATREGLEAQQQSGCEDVIHRFSGYFKREFGFCEVHGAFRTHTHTVTTKPGHWFPQPASHLEKPEQSEREKRARFLARRGCIAFPDWESHRETLAPALQLASAALTHYR